MPKAKAHLKAVADSDDPPTPTDLEAGHVILDDALATIRRYVVFPDDHAAVAVVLWIAATHGVNAFEHAPRLAIVSPEKRCGKSRLLDVIAGLCHAPLITVNATVAAIFRSIEDRQPTLIMDEADTLWGTKQAADGNEDLRGLFNAGHQRNRPVIRCVGPAQTPTPFETFAMAALAGIGRLPDTITDRAVNVTLRRRTPDEAVQPFRSRRDGPVLVSLRDRLAAWVFLHHDDLAAAQPAMPVEDRAADTWEPLIAVADAAGGDWPELARAACEALVAGAEEDDADQSIERRLLGDVRQVFIDTQESVLPSKRLLGALRLIEDAPWADPVRFDANRLAKMLRQYRVKPGRFERNTVRGYALAGPLAEAFDRYLPALNPDDPGARLPPVDG